MIPDETARADALKSGDVNMIYTTERGDANRLAGDFQVTQGLDHRAARSS